MRVDRSNASAGATSGPTVARPRAGAFQLSDSEPTRCTTAPAALRTVGGIDALIALQGLEDASERRKRAVTRGRLALDALDELKIAVLGGSLSQVTLSKLRSAAAFLQTSSGEPGLDSLLGEINLRLEVEVAKLSAR